jgi:hypothetical protein
MNVISIRVRKTAREMCNWSGKQGGNRSGVDIERERMIIAVLSGSVVGG